MFCVHCGRPLQRAWLGSGPAPAESEIAPACSACSYIHYEGPVPVAAAIVRRGSEILLVQPHGASHHALVSGFLHPGETVEDAIVREIAEEAGLTVAVRGILGSYPGLPGRNIVLIVCVAEVVGGVLAIQQSELAAAAWFTLDTLPAWPAEWPLHRVFADYASSEFAARASADVSPSR
jgi:NAD+ diphosphatase